MKIRKRASHDKSSPARPLPNTRRCTPHNVATRELYEIVDWCGRVNSAAVGMSRKMAAKQRVWGIVEYACVRMVTGSYISG